MAISFTSWTSGTWNGEAITLTWTLAGIRGWPAYPYLCALRAAMKERFELLNEQFTVTDETPDEPAQDAPITAGWVEDFEDALDTLIGSENWANHEDNSGNWSGVDRTATADDMIPFWDKTDLLAECTDTTEINYDATDPLRAEWILQKYEMLDRLRWTRSRDIGSTTDSNIAITTQGYVLTDTIDTAVDTEWDNTGETFDGDLADDWANVIQGNWVANRVASTWWGIKEVATKATDEYELSYEIGQRKYTVTQGASATLSAKIDLYFMPNDFYTDGGVNPPTWQLWGAPDTVNISPWQIDKMGRYLSTGVLAPSGTDNTGFLGPSPAISPPVPYNAYSSGDWWENGTHNGGAAVGYLLSAIRNCLVYKWNVTNGFKMVSATV